ncbi:protein FMC1 homolog [Ictalurus furcatus]|uniref:protein FMC1 homolog n=1 Tax=Ictalurus furcatus TaxID=66913 RepID=UPI00234FD40B|nr:protein FMC1 homolog [Ictalurus furcatus]
MAALSSPLRICRSILKELRYLKGPEYKGTMMYSYVLEQFRKNQVTSERYCRAQREAVHMSHTYLYLLESTRHHLELHNHYHGKGERTTQEAASLVGLRLPTQPGGKGWED